MGRTLGRDKNEAWFKGRMTKMLTANGNMVTPIQTRTIPGVPDVFVSTQGGGYWIEFKRVHASFYNRKKDVFVIPFRTGQQSWAAKHYATSRQAVTCYVLFNDEIVKFPISHVRPYGRYCVNEMTLGTVLERRACFGDVQ